MYRKHYDDPYRCGDTRQVCISYQDIRLLMALTAGLVSPEAPADSTAPVPITLPEGPGDCAAPAGKEQAGAGGELNLRAGLVGLRLAIYNDCPGFR